MELKSELFKNEALLINCIHGNHRIEYGENDNSINKIQEALTIIEYYTGEYTGCFDYDTMLATINFKTENNIFPNDGVIGVKTLAKLDNIIFTHEVGVTIPEVEIIGNQSNSLQELRQWYIDASYRNAFGTESINWEPHMGYGANRETILKLYEYYQKTFQLNPQKFLWAGLGRMAGGAVVGGLDTLVLVHSDPSPTTQRMVTIGKNIFLDLAWQHEAYLDLKPKGRIDRFFDLISFHNENPAVESYYEAWQNIDSNDFNSIVKGNRMLLKNEQYSIIQPQYELLMMDGDLSFWENPSPFTGNIHPYHRDFLCDTDGDILNFNKRWAWISDESGLRMFEKWAKIPDYERTRLVSLSMHDLIFRNWAPIIEEYMPVGAFNSEDQ